MNAATKQNTMRLLEEAKDRVSSVYYFMDAEKQSRFAKRADTITCKLLDLIDDIRLS